MSAAICFVCWSVAIGFVTIALPAILQTKAAGLPWNAGPRDTPPTPMGVLGNRLDRARANFLETYPLFLAAILVAVARQKDNHWITWGAELYVWGRLIYIPLYAFGIPYVRTLVWIAATAGIVMVLYGAALT